MLKVENLTVEYTGIGRAIEAVSSVSFELGQSESLGLVGESGSGKTTLASSLLGLTADNAKISGQVFFNDKELTGLSEKEFKKLRWRHLAMVPQNTLEALNPVLTVGTQVEEPLRTHFSLDRGELKARVIELFALVGLEESWCHCYPHQLSGGMRQRVLIAMAISCNPELLIVDEPTISLDAIARQQILDLLCSLQRKGGFALISISHDLPVIKVLAREMFVIYNGGIVEAGPTKEIIDEPAHPYTRGLINSSPDINAYKDMWGIPGEALEGRNIAGCSFYPRCNQSQEICVDEKPVLKENYRGRKIACHRGGQATILRTENLSKTFRTGNKVIEAVKKVTTEVHEGEVAALVGESGSGKSTLAQLLAGVIEPGRGQAYFKNKPIKGTALTRQFDGIQIVFQDPFSSTSHRLTVAEAVKEPLVITGCEKREDILLMVEETLQMVQLPAEEHFLKRYCCELSGGQRQRVALARALVMKPKLLIADEITSMLDPSTRANLLRLLKGLQNSCGFTMLFITHDLSLARKIADRIMVMLEGSIVEEGATGKTLKKPCHCYTKKLLDPIIDPDTKSTATEKQNITI